MLVESIWRYPVKSMLGQQLAEAHVTSAGVAGDRRFAVIDGRTGGVASAKQPRLWRSLLSATAEELNGSVRVHLPGERLLALDDPQAPAHLSTFLGRDVQVSSTPQAGADMGLPPVRLTRSGRGGQAA